MTNGPSAAEILSTAQALDTAWTTRRAISPISTTFAGIDVTAAYAIQTAWTQTRVARGERIVGRKIGLTNPAIQAQLGVNEPDYGALWESSFYETKDGVVLAPTSDFLQPRVEGEVAFLIGKPLGGSPVTAADVLAATEACALAVEIVDSRIADWKIKLADTIADNASYGGFAVGDWDKTLPGKDLAALAMTVTHNGEAAGEGLGSAVLGNPAESTAWLVNKLSQFGVILQPGDVVISGAITKMLPAKQGDAFVFTLTGQPDLTVKFT